MSVSPETKRRVLALLKPRRATCGACGCDDVVDHHMRTDRAMQWTPRPDQETDAYYCGCQDDDVELGAWWDPFKI